MYALAAATREPDRRCANVKLSAVHVPCGLKPGFRSAKGFWEGSEALRWVRWEASGRVGADGLARGAAVSWLRPSV